jgi:hypothetical protein
MTTVAAAPANQILPILLALRFSVLTDTTKLNCFTSVTETLHLAYYLTPHRNHVARRKERTK